MSGFNSKNRKNRRKNPCGNSRVQLFGLILLIIGIITICAFLLPVKAWVMVLGIILLIFGGILIKG